MQRSWYCTFAVLTIAWITHAMTLSFAAPADVPAPVPVSAEAIASLRTAAVGDDSDKSMSALRQLAALSAATGQSAAPRASQALAEVVPQLLTRDAATIESDAAAVAPQLAKAQAAQADMETLRAESIQAVERMDHDPASLTAAKRNYVRLSSTAAKFTPVCARQMQVAAALARRELCVQLVAKSKPAAADTDRPARLARQALAMPPEAALALMTGPLNPPADAAQRPLWFYIACRRIESWNHQLEPLMNAAEITHARRVNAYRELLGLLPYEFDARLIQSARRHSKEMQDLWYFGHYSPIEAERLPETRMARAGYPDASNENITMGSWTGDDAFWQFFNSPGHHRVWLDRDATAMGVGKWEFGWTEDIGNGPRLMTAAPAEREKGTVVGAELKPQAKELTRQRPRDLGTIKFYDETGQEVKALPAGTERKTGVRPGP
jgi:uncharacterized protein YkwD